MYLVIILKYSNVRVFSIHTLNTFKSIHIANTAFRLYFSGWTFSTASKIQFLRAYFSLIFKCCFSLSKVTFSHLL